MADLHILRQHALGLPAARKIAAQWAEQAQEEFGMACTYAQGPTVDEVSFIRSGVHGRLLVTSEQFELTAKLGFLLGAFKARIEGEIVKNLDTLLQVKAKPSPKRAAKTPAVKKK